MGSSKKKHKKHKDKDREKSSKSKSSEMGISYHNSLGPLGAGGMVATSYLVDNSAWDGQTADSSTPGATLKAPSLRLVLKVPPSAYSPQATMLAPSSATRTIYQSHNQQPLAPVHSPSQLGNHASTYQTEPVLTFPGPYDAPMDPSASQNYAPISTTSNGDTVTSMAPMAMSGDGTFAAYPNPLLFSGASLSKKPKKSKKSKKSKHRKHTHHSHTHSHKHHKKHHHNSTYSHHSSASSSSTSVTLPPGCAAQLIKPAVPAMTDVATTIGHDWLPSIQPEDVMTDPYCLPTTRTQIAPAPTINNNLMATINDTGQSVQSSPGLEKLIIPVNHQQNISTSTHSKQMDAFLASMPCLSPPMPSHIQSIPKHPKADWLATSTLTMTNGMMSNAAHNNSTSDQPPYYQLSNNAPLGHHTGPELKLKLSKTSATAQYSANLKHSPVKSFVTPNPTPVPTLVVTPPKLNANSTIANCNNTTNQHDPILSINTVNLAVNTAPTNSANLAVNTISPISAPVTPITPSPTFSSKSGSHKSSKKPRAEKNLNDLLAHLLRQLTRKDSQHFFAMPVSEAIAPGYSSIISHPMDLSTIRKKIAAGQYLNLGDFKADVKLICDNAMKYNRPETIYYKSASKLWHYTKSKLFKKDALADYAKSYAKCTPLELSLNPSQPPVANKSVNGSAPSGAFSGLHSLGAELTTVPSYPTGMLGQSSIGFGESSGLSFGLSALSTSTPFKPGNEPSGFIQMKKIAPPSPFTKSPTRPTVKKEICADGMSAEELVESIQESAIKVHEALLRLKHPPQLTYLSPEPDTGLFKKTVIYENYESDEDDETVSSQTVSLSNLYSPSENGRIDFNLLTGGGTTIHHNGDWKELFGIDLKKMDIKQEIDSSGPVKDTIKIKVEEKDETECAVSSASVDSTDETKAVVTTVEDREQLRKELIETYGCDEFGLKYALSIARFGKNSEFTINLVASLLGVLTTGNHRTVSTKFYQLLDQLTETDDDDDDDEDDDDEDDDDT